MWFISTSYVFYLVSLPVVSQLLIRFKAFKARALYVPMQQAVPCLCHWSMANDKFFLKMVKQATDPDASQPPQKKPKFPTFRSSLQSLLPRPCSSRSTSSSTVVTISQNEGGRWHGTGQYRNQQASTPQPTIERDILVNSAESVLDSVSTTFNRDGTVDPCVSEPTAKRDDPSEPIYVSSTPKRDFSTVGRQNSTTTPASKAKQKRNNNAAVSPFHFIWWMVFSLICLELPPRMASTSTIFPRWNPSSRWLQRLRRQFDLFHLWGGNRSL